MLRIRFVKRLVKNVKMMFTTHDYEHKRSNNAF